MRRLSLASAACCALIWCQLASALDPAKAITQYVHSTWGTVNGLPQNSVTRILETRDGYLWVGTQAGLARFDGVSFTTFDHTNTPSLQRDYISDLVEDGQGTLWIATSNGGVALFRDGLFSHVDTIQPRGGMVLAADPDGSMWVGGYDGLKHFEKGHLTRTYTVADGLSGDPVVHLVVDGNGAVWVGSPGGLNRLADGKVQTFSASDGLPGKEVSGLVLLADGTLLAKTQNFEFVRWENRRFVPWRLPGLVSDNVHAVFLDRDGNLWLASGNEGLFRVTGKQLNQFTAKDGLASDAVARIYEDRDGNVWVGTQSGGLERFRDGTFTPFAKEEGLSSDQVFSLIEDGIGDMWIATSNGLNRLHDNRTLTYPAADKLLDTWSLWIDHASNLLIGTSSAGIAQLAHDHSLISLSECAGAPAHLISGIVDGSDHQLWIATRGGGLLQCAAGTVTGVYTTRTGLLSDTLYALTRGGDGTIWVGGDNGLNSIQNGHVKSYPSLDNVSNVWVISLYLDSDNVLWIGTFGQGLFRLADGHVTRYTTHQGLPNDTIDSIVEDAATNLWIGSDNGISRISRRDLDVVAKDPRASFFPLVFGTADGMKSSATSGGSQPSAWRSRDGRLWFPTARGIVVADPSRLKLSERAPVSRIEQVSADETPVALTSAMRLPPGTRRLEIRYTAPNLSSPGRTQFRYRLDGFDEQWIPGGVQRLAQYTNLSPGNYTFHVDASTDTGHWGVQDTTLNFMVIPRFYQTWWFRLLSGLAVVSLLWGAYRLRVSFLHARTAVLEERQRIARDIHDSLAQGLSAIIFHTQAALYSLTKATEMTSTHMTSVLDLAVSSLDDARYSVWDLSPSVLDPKNLAESLSSMAKLLARGRVETLEILSSGTEWALPPAANHHVVLIAQEAISNAIQHGHADNISVNLEYQHEALVLSVSDNGIGFDSNPAIGGRTSGYGMRNMQHRADRLGATLKVDSAAGTGTNILLHIRKLGRFKNMWNNVMGRAKVRDDG